MKKFAVAFLACLLLSFASVFYGDVVRPTADGAVSLVLDNAWTGVNTFIDTNFRIIGSSDATKIARFEVDGLTAAATRIITVPDSNTSLPIISQIITITGPTAARSYAIRDANDTIATVGAANTFTNGQVFALAATFNNSVNINLGTTTGSAGIQANPNLTPDAPTFFTGTASESFHMIQVGDAATDMGNGPAGTAANVDPTLVVHSAAADQTQYAAIAAYGLSMKSVKTLTEAAATSIVRIPIAAEEGTTGELIVSVYATDGSTPQVRGLRIIYNASADGATETCVLGTAEETDNTPTGTLTATVTCDTTPTQAVDLQINATSSLTQTTLEARWTLINVGPGLPARQ